MKHVDALKVEREALEALSDLLHSIPSVQHVEVEPTNIGAHVDIIAHFTFVGRPLTLICEVKSSGQPRFVRGAIYQLKHHLITAQGNSVPLVIAPFLSEQAQAICREEQVGYLDFAGNALIAFDTVYIERTAGAQPKAEKRALRSLFKPKSARILRTLLREPGPPWRVTELANAAGVSIGLASSVGTALRDREWAIKTDDGLALRDPDGLLDAWAAEYEPPEGRQVRLYTHLHGAALDDAVRDAMSDHAAGRILLGSYSAADWLAPYARNSNRYLYADRQGLADLTEALRLTEAEKGGNVIVNIPNEDGVFADMVRPEPGIACTSPVQTYLDLIDGGERGREAADHLRRELLQWH